ncbi:hypothetical protein EDB83DRAFT_172832 [Lactarius deliciosus]|nr:hypothetical protein EDB83DRAFT_172832 [Lactarius deliciosus]
MRTMHLLDRQTTSPTTASPLPPATMTSPTACRPMILPRKSSARTTTNLVIRPLPRRERERPRQPHVRGSSPMMTTKTTMTGTSKMPPPHEGPAGSFHTRCRVPRSKQTRRSPSSLCRRRNVAKSGVNNLAPAPVLSDEEQVEVRSPVKPLRKPVQLVPDSSPLTDGTPKEPAAPTPAALKDAQHEYPPQPKFNPQLKVPAQFAAAPASTTSSAPAPAQTPAKAAPHPFDKILITIRHTPTEKENKFKVKSTHLVGRVLTSACSAFGLNPTGATLMAWTEEDGLEMTSPCTNDASMGTVATDGAIFIIELAK